MNQQEFIDGTIPDDELPTLENYLMEMENSGEHEKFINDIKEAYMKTHPSNRRVREDLIYMLDYLNDRRPDIHEEMVRFFDTSRRLRKK